MLSLSMIARNEAEGIGHILGQAATFCDEMVVLDTGSTDDTIAIARDAGADVHEMEWPNSFAKARNAAQDLTHGEWVIHLDGHDNLPLVSIEGFKNLKPELDNLPDNDAVITPMVMISHTGEPLLSWPRERITRRNLRWNNDAHTIISPQKPIHRPYPVQTLQRTGTKPARARSVLKEQYEAGDHSPRTVFYHARETFWGKKYAEAIPLYNEWLGMNPCAWEKYSGLIDLAACYQMLGKPRAASTVMLMAVETIPTRAEAWAALGGLAMNEKRWADAAMYFRNCLHATRPIEGFVVERWYGDYPKTLLDICLKNQ